MTEGLRARQKAVAREAILAAVADNISEDGLLELSMPEVARRAGVSLRTVYNYFPNRGVLLDGLDDWASERMIENGFPERVESLDEIPEAMAAAYRAFAAMEGLSIAFARIDRGADERTSRSRDQNTKLLLDLAEQRLAHLPADDRRSIALLLRAMGSTRFWYLLTADLGLDYEDAAQVASWTARIVIEAALEEE